MKVVTSIVSFSFALVLATIASGEDAQDKLVYGRYSRGVQASNVKYPRTGDHVTREELDHPATKEDVENGRAVFTFEGLGTARVWKLPKCPIQAKWPAEEKHATDDDPSRGRGYVCQAEEIQVDGNWKRYFGFLTKRRRSGRAGGSDRVNLAYFR